MRKKINNSLILLINVVLILSFLSGCAASNKGTTSSNSNTTSKTSSNTNNNSSKVDVTVGNTDTTKANTNAPVKTVAPTNVPPVNSSAGGAKSAVNSITAKQSTANPTQMPAINVLDQKAFSDAIILNLSEGKDMAINLQGKYTKDTIAAEAMKVIETSGYAGYLSGIEYGVSNNVGYIYFKYKGDVASFLTKSKAVDGIVKDIVAKVVNSSMSDYDKELALHDYVVNNVSYDYVNLMKNTIPDDSYTAYGALLKGVAVCEGYAESMYKLLRAAEVKSYIINGFGNGVAHEWNLVNINGGIYHLDATFDDPISATNKVITHNYFNVNDVQISKDHTWNNLDYPKSTAVAANYFNVNNFFANNKSKYYDIVKNELIKKSTTIDIRTGNYDTNVYTSDVILKVLKDNPGIDFVDTSKGYSFSYDPSSNVVEFNISYK